MFALQKSPFEDKIIFNVMENVFEKIYENSMTKRIFSDNIKIACVTPIFKYAVKN